MIANPAASRICPSQPPHRERGRADVPPGYGFEIFGRAARQFFNDACRRADAERILLVVLQEPIQLRDDEWRKAGRGSGFQEHSQWNILISDLPTQGLSHRVGDICWRGQARTRRTMCLADMGPGVG
jgi:hypothetical protein